MLHVSIVVAHGADSTYLLAVALSCSVGMLECENLLRGAKMVNAFRHFLKTGPILDYTFQVFLGFYIITSIHKFRL